MTLIPAPDEPWQGALNEHGAAPERVAEQLRRAVVGKRVRDVTLDAPGTDEELTVMFEDGTALVVRSYDYEGYSSGFYIHRVP